MVRVAVVGAYGRMGTATCGAVAADAGTDLVATVGSQDRLDAVLDAGADVAVEFTTPSTVKANVAWLLERGVHVVVGATGLDGGDLADLESRTGPANCFVAPNFAIGAVLMMRFAEQAAVYLPDVEIIELHHEGKVDAPSGTALLTAERIAGARRRSETPAATGPARGEDHEGVPIHSVRLPGIVASQEVVFGATGQTLSLRHDAIDRSSFMPGVLLAIKRVASLPGLTVGLDTLLSGA